MSELPTSPSGKIIRQKDAANWIDGFAFLEAAKTEAEKQNIKLVDERKQGRREGYRQGYDEGARDAAKLLCETTGKINEYVASLEAEVVNLCIGIVSKIIGQYSSTEVVTRLAIEALNGFQQEREITLMVAPELADAVAQQLAKDYINPALKITVLPDANLVDTQCVLSNAVAVIDAGLETQLAAIRSALIAQDVSKNAGRS